MPSYGQDVTELARAAAVLVATGPRQPQLDGQWAAATLSARDSVVAGLRRAWVAVTDTDRLNPARLSPAEHPVGALTKALRGLPPAAPEVAPSDAAVLRGAPADVGGRWAAAAAAGLGLERWSAHDWSGLSPAAAWGAARDLARIASALPQLDGDLAGRLPPGHAAAEMLLDPTRHAAVRIGAAEVLRLAGSGELSDAAAARESGPVSPMVVPGPGQVPDGMRRLRAQLAAQPRLSPGDLSAASAALERVAAGSASALRAAPHLDGPARAVEALRRPLAKLVTGRRLVRGLTAPDPLINGQARELAGAADRLRRSPDAAGSLPAAVAAAEQLPTVVLALRHAVARSVSNSGFAVANYAADSHVPAGPVWVPSRSPSHPDLRQLLDAVDAAATATRPVVGAAAVARGVLGLPANPAQLAAADKAAAMSDLSAALARRPASPTEPARPQRPNLRPGPGR